MFESGAILMHLAEHSALLLPREGEARSLALQWLFFQTAGLGPMCGQFNHFAMFAPPGNDYAISRYTTEVRRLYGVLDGRLADVPWLAGEDYTLADAAVFPWLHNQSRRFGSTHQFMDMGATCLCNIARWYHAALRRDAIATAIAVFASIPSTLALASRDELDRVFGRGGHATAADG